MPIVLSHRGNLVLPASAHPAFNKAALLMDLEVRRVPVARDFRADPAAMAKIVDADTTGENGYYVFERIMEDVKRQGLPCCATRQAQSAAYPIRISRA